MGLWQVLSAPFRTTDTKRLTEIYGGDNWSGEIVTSQGAMKLSAFWACTRLYSQIIATLPLGIYRKAPDGDRVPVPDHPLNRLLRESPNSEQTAVEFWEERVLGLCTTGNGFAEKIIGSEGRIISLEHMPADTGVRRLENGQLEYSFSRHGKSYTLPESKVFHIRAFGSGDDGCGLSPVGYARQTLGLAMATERASAQVYSKGMRAKGFFTTPGLLKPEQREQIQKTLVAPFSGNSGKDWGVLEAGLDVKTVNITPRDAELILSRKFNVEDICRWFGIPPIMIGHAGQGTTMWGTGVEQVMLGFYKTGLIPYLERIEQRIAKDLFTPKDRANGVYAEFSVEGLLRGDSTARAALYSSLIQNGVMKPSLAAQKENFPVVPEADQLFVNATLVPISQAGRKQPGSST